MIIFGEYFLISIFWYSPLKVFPGSCPTKVLSGGKGGGGGRGGKCVARMIFMVHQRHAVSTGNKYTNVQIQKCTNTEMHKYRKFRKGGPKGDNVNPLPIFLQQVLPMNQCFVRIVNCKNSKH